MGLTVCFLVLGSMQAYATKESDMIQEKEINVPKEKDEFFQNLSDEECYQPAVLDALFSDSGAHWCRRERMGDCRISGSGFSVGEAETQRSHRE